MTARAEVGNVLQDNSRILMVGRSVAAPGHLRVRIKGLPMLPSPAGVVPALALTWRRFQLVTCVDAVDGIDERAWYPASRYLADRVAESGHLIAEHDVATATVLHPLFVAAGLELVGATIEGTRETSLLCRARRSRGVYSETRSRLRMVRRVPADLSVDVAEVDLATGRIDGGRSSLPTRTVIRAHGRAVGVIEIPGPVTSESLVPLAEAALAAGGLPTVVGSSPSPDAQHTDSKRTAGSHCVNEAAHRRTTPEVRCVPLWRHGPNIGRPDVRRLADEVDGNGWLLFVPPVCDMGDLKTLAQAALAADGDDGLAALVGVVAPATVPNGPSGRWWLAELFRRPAPGDSSAVLTRLADSSFAALRADAAARCWPDQPGSTDPLTFAVASLVSSGAQVRMASGLVVITGNYSWIRMISSILATARRTGRLERMTGQRLTGRDAGRPSGIGTSAEGPVQAVWLSAARSVTQAGRATGHPVTLPVSTSSGRLACRLLGEGCCGAVAGEVVGGAVGPAAPDDADPGAGEDAHGVGMVLAGGAGVIVGRGGPGAGVAAVVGEDGLGARPVSVQQRGELVGRGDPHVHQVITGAHHCAQRPRFTGVRHGGRQPVVAQPQVLRDDRSVPASDWAPDSTSPSRQALIAFGLTGTTGWPPSSSRSTSRPSEPPDCHWQISGVTELRQAADQHGDPVRGMLDGELGHGLARGVHHAHGMRGSGSVDPGKDLGIRQHERQRGSLQWQRRPGEEDSHRAVTNADFHAANSPLAAAWHAVAFGESAQVSRLGPAGARRSRCRDLPARASLTVQWHSRPQGEGSARNRP